MPGLFLILCLTFATLIPISVESEALELALLFVFSVGDYLTSTRIIHSSFAGKNRYGLSWTSSSEARRIQVW